MPDVYAQEICYEDGYLKIKVTERQAQRVLNNIEPGWLKIAKREKPKSYEQIKMLWKLCELIAQKKSQIEKQIATKEQIYREAVKDVGVFEVLEIDNSAINDFAKRWHSHGTGWFINILDIGEERSQIIAYYGCSMYTKKEMTRLIENVVQDAKALGINVNSQELESLIRSEE